MPGFTDPQIDDIRFSWHNRKKLAAKLTVSTSLFMQKDAPVKKNLLLLVLVNLYLLSAPISVTSTVAGQSDSGQESGYEMLYWDSVKDSNIIDMYRAYLNKYPNGVFVDLAKIKIKALENKAPLKPAAAPGMGKDAKEAVDPSGMRLRSEPEILEEIDVKKMLKKYNFCDLKRNYNGDFKNAFHDEKNGAITDEATGLIWQKVGSWRKMSRRYVDAYIEDLNNRKFSGKSNWRWNPSSLERGIQFAD